MERDKKELNLKECGWCGMPAQQTADNFCRCNNTACPLVGFEMTFDAWNWRHRPTHIIKEHKHGTS